MVPTFASYISDLNPRLIKAGATPINLTSIMIGALCALLYILNCE